MLFELIRFTHGYVCCNILSFLAVGNDVSENNTCCGLGSLPNTPIKSSSVMNTIIYGTDNYVSGRIYCIAERKVKDKHPREKNEMELDSE